MDAVFPQGLLDGTENTLETGGEDVQIHSKRVGKMFKYTRKGWGRCSNTLETSGEDQNTLQTSIFAPEDPPSPVRGPTVPHGLLPLIA